MPPMSDEQAIFGDVIDPETVLAHTADWPTSEPLDSEPFIDNVTGSNYATYEDLQQTLNVSQRVLDHAGDQQHRLDLACDRLTEIERTQMLLLIAVGAVFLVAALVVAFSIL